MHGQKHITGTMGILDRIRLKSGSEAMKSHFLKTAQADKSKALTLINSGRLRFATLYILWPEIDSLHLYDELSLRNRTALRFCTSILSGTDPANLSVQASPEASESAQNALRWMLSSGLRDDGLCDDFDQILDAAALYLTRIYHDNTFLPELIRTIFRRNRKGRYIHDMVWALFSSGDPQILGSIAVYLRSQNERDLALANRLLKHGAADGADGRNRNGRYKRYISWFRENRPYIYFTEESFHQGSDPILYSLDMDSKYLCRKVPPKGQKSMTPFTQDDHFRLEPYHGAKDSEMVLLARYSNLLYAKNKKLWNNWMGYPIEKQLKIARSRLGETR